MNPKRKNTIAWIATCLMALLFLVSGGFKLMGNEDALNHFSVWSYPKWMCKVIGGLEIFGAIGLFIPKLRSLAVYGLIGIMVGAIYTRAINEGMPTASIEAIIAILLGIVVLQMKTKEV